MRRAERLFRIIEKLRPGRLITARELARAMEVSERTIYRDIAHLIGSGLPIEGEAGLGYVMRGGYDLPPIMFSEAEIVALTAGARMVAAWGGSQMVQGAESALDKIGAVAPEAVRARAERVRIHAWGGLPRGHPVRAILDAVEAAIERPHRLWLRYADESGRETERMVRPLGLWFWGKVWTLVAWCELRQDFRMFRLDRMRAAETRDAYVPVPGQDLEAFRAAQGAPPETDRDQATDALA